MDPTGHIEIEGATYNPNKTKYKTVRRRRHKVTRGSETYRRGNISRHNIEVETTVEDIPYLASSDDDLPDTSGSSGDVATGTKTENEVKVNGGEGGGGGDGEGDDSGSTGADLFAQYGALYSAMKQPQGSQAPANPFFYEQFGENTFEESVELSQFFNSDSALEDALSDVLKEIDLAKGVKPDAPITNKQSIYQCSLGVCEMVLGVGVFIYSAKHGSVKGVMFGLYLFGDGGYKIGQGLVNRKAQWLLDDFLLPWTNMPNGDNHFHYIPGVWK